MSDSETRRRQEHGEKLKRARVQYRAPRVCPDCYRPKHLCPHTEEWAFLRRR